MSSQSLNLNQQQRQLQSLSPLQVRYFRMLEMTQAQAEDEVKRELEENPALEAEYEAEPDSVNESDEFSETAEELQLADYAGEDDIPFYRLETNNRSSDDRRYEPEAADIGNTLLDTLMEQARELKIGDRQLETVAFVAGNLDSNGYMTRSVPQMSTDMSALTGRDVSHAEIAEALEVVRTLEPAGVGAGDLRECLLLQLRRRADDSSNHLAIEIVTHYFDLFSKKHYDKLMTALDTDRDSLRRAIGIITSLNPKPGSEVEGVTPDDRLSHITPDFAVEVDSANGSLTVTELGNMPRLGVDPNFAAVARDSDSAAFIRRQRDQAEGFISIVNIRRNTLLKVVKAIADYQHSFLVTGDESRLRPMVLRDISAVTGFDQSVISRATHGKYLLTPWGTMPLKYLFNERFNDNDELSARRITAEIKMIIDGEDRDSPLTDEAIVTILAGRGYTVARRTVAKYRENLGLPVARLRREL